MGIAINVLHKFAVCRSCQVAILGSQLFAHLQNKHKDIPLPSDVKSKITKTLDSLDLITQFVYPTTFPIPAMDGLNIIEGFSCPNCPIIIQSLEYMKRHYNKHHPHIKKPKK